MSFFLAVNFIATGTQCKDRLPGQVILMNADGKILLNRVIEVPTKEYVHDPLTKITGLTKQMLRFGFPLLRVDEELSKLVHGGEKLYLANYKESIERFFPLTFHKLQAINFSEMLSVFDAESQQHHYFSVKEVGKSLLCIDSQRTFNNLAMNCDIMRQSVDVVDVYGKEFVQDRLRLGRELRWAQYVPFKNFNGICFSRFDKNHCSCESVNN